MMTSRYQRRIDMKRTIPFRLEPDKHKSFMIFCVKNEMHAQTLLEEYVNMLLISEEKGIDFLEMVRGLFREKVEGYDGHGGNNQNGRTGEDNGE
jgi:hypothetical protein